jgi:hypothetical protein
LSHRFCAVFEYLNHSVIATEAHLAHDTVRKRILQIFDSEKCNIVRALKEVPGAIHIAWDGWRSRNRHALHGITAHYLEHCGNLPEGRDAFGIPAPLQEGTFDCVPAQIDEFERPWW